MSGQNLDRLCAGADGKCQASASGPRKGHRDLHKQLPRSIAGKWDLRFLSVPGIPLRAGKARGREVK